MEASDYIAYWLSEPGKSSCVRSGAVLQLSHDEVNRFLAGNNFSGKDLFDKAKAAVQLHGGVLSVDDTVIDKPYSNPDANELVSFFWSGLHHKSIKGMNLIVLNYTDSNSISLPVNWRVYRHRDNKTKNDYFQDMVNRGVRLGITPGMDNSRFMVQLSRKPEVLNKQGSRFSGRTGKEPPGFHSATSL